MSSKKYIDLFNILKLNTSYIIANKSNIEISYKDAKRNGLVVSLGDNQLLKFIRRIREKPFDKNEVYKLYKERDYCKSLPESKNNTKKIISLQSMIDEILFVPDIVSVKTDTTKKDYKSICRNYFSIKITINKKTYNIRYRRLCAGAGQLRRNSAIFVNEEIFDQLEQIMMCGLTRKKIGKMNLSKFGAYLALYTSASKQVSRPNICVVKDMDVKLKNQNVLWIFDNDKMEKDIKNITMDMDINAFDGSGMISVEMAQKWSKDLDLDYLPASFIIRSAWIKGLVSVFDFKKFAKEVAHKDTIIDAWGNEKNIDNIDVILTTSQFKMY